MCSSDLIEPDQSKDTVLSIVKKSKNIVKYLKDSELKKEIYIPNKIINFVVR